jgi:hypothetical protein
VDEARAAAARELQEIRRALAERFEVTDRAAESTRLLSFTARDRRDTRPVELHVLTRRLASLAPVDRVLAALERVTALHDPRIVPIRDCGLLQGIVWFATPPVEGTSLRDRRPGSATCSSTACRSAPARPRRSRSPRSLRSSASPTESP